MSKPTIKQKKTTNSNNSITKPKPRESSQEKIVSKTSKVLATSTPTSVKKSTSKSSLTKTPITSKTLEKPTRKPTETPPSKRITKTQLLPSKSRYSNIIEEQQIKQHLLQNKVSSKLDNSEMAIINASLMKPQPTTSKHRENKVISKQDRSEVGIINTSLIKSQPILISAKDEVSKKQDNIIINSPEFSSTHTERPRTATLKKSTLIGILPHLDTHDASSNDYEDDFESYESDFEEYVSSDVSSITSSSTSLPDKDNPKHSAEEERMLDSGHFDLPEHKHKQFLNDIKETNNEVTYTMASLSDEGFEESSLQFINFLDAKRKLNQNKYLAERKKRGEEILSMIRLDCFNFTLFELKPASYDAFIKTYGKRNTVQVSIQTGEDDVSEDNQTDFIEMCSKSTQFPVNTFNCEEKFLQNYNSKRLEKFIVGAGRTILKLLDEMQLKNSNNFHNNTEQVPFSDGHIKIDFNESTVLQNYSHSLSACFVTTDVRFVTVHNKNKQVSDDDSEFLNLICVWKTSDNQPEYVLGINSNISSCNFIPELNVVCVGLNDGLIAGWCLRNNEFYETITNPSYVTDIATGHTSKVTCISVLTKSATGDIHSNSNQICTLEENGSLIVWSLILKNKNHISMIQNSKIFLGNVNPNLKNLLCLEMIIDKQNHVYVTTNYGYILHCVVSGRRKGLKQYAPATTCGVTCLKFCPFSPKYMIAGYENGILAIYSCLVEKPLKILYNTDNNTQDNQIIFLEWSYHKPCVLYVKDRSNTIYLWDLALSDMYPIYSVPFKEELYSMRLLSALTRHKRGSAYMALTTKHNIYFHILNQDYGSSDSEQQQQDTRRLLNYINRL